MRRDVDKRAEARAAVMQLRSLLLADAPIDRIEAQRLANLAAELTPADMDPMEVTDILVILIGFRSTEEDGMHHVDDPTGEAIRILDRLTAPRPRKKRRWWSMLIDRRK